MISIQAKDLGKAYRIYEKPINSLKEFILRRSYHKTFWALQNVNFSLSQGTSLGIIGGNGAGKTTLLQLLAGTIAPTNGAVERHGRVSAILELGSGFHPDLTGIENIRLGCAMIGLSPAETEKRLSKIIEFSELENFIKHQVKTYSTGMYARLAFSVATAVNPDILIVDEALSVGDQHFQKKCVDHMLQFQEQGKILIFCSHFMYLVQKVCKQCLWLRDGKPEVYGQTIEVTERYQDYARSLDAQKPALPSTANEKSGEADRHLEDTPKQGANIIDVTLAGDIDNGLIETGGTFKVCVKASLSTAAKKEDTHLGLLINRNDNTRCYGLSTEMDQSKLYPLTEDEYGVSFVIDKLPLLAGKYSLDIFLLDGSGMHLYDVRNGIVPFTVRQGTKEVGVARLPHRWEKPGGAVS